MNLNYIEPIKAIATFVVSSGVGSIVGQTLRNTIPEDAGRIKKIVMSVGAVALSSMLSHQVSEYVGEQIDTLNNNIREAIKAGAETKNPDEEAAIANAQNIFKDPEADS